MEPIFRVPLPPPMTTVLLASTRKNIGIFLALLTLPIFLTYMYLSSINSEPANEQNQSVKTSGELLVFISIFLFLSFITLKFSGYFNIYMLFRIYKGGKSNSLYDLKGYLSINKVFTMIPKHLEGGEFKPYLFLHETQYESINNNFDTREIVSNGFQIFNNHQIWDFNPLIIAQPFSDDLCADINNGEACRFIGNNRYGLIFINNKIIYLKGKNIIKISRG
jgi:hypothetical protein